MDEYYDYYDDDAYRPDGVNITGPMGGPGPFGGMPPFGQPPFGQPPFGQPPFGQPPFGQPPFGQPPFGQPPFGQPPFGQPPFGQQFGPPSGPPPAFTPPKAAAVTGFGAPGVFKVNPGAIRPCRFRYVFIWPESGRGFWAWLTFVGRDSIAGWRWNGFRWVYFGMDLDDISSFVCF